MRTIIAALLALALTGGAACAQDSYTQQRLGGFTFYNGQLNGQPLSGSSTRLGDTEFSTFQNGGRTTSCTSTNIGGTVFTNCN